MIEEKKIPVFNSVDIQDAINGSEKNAKRDGSIFDISTLKDEELIKVFKVLFKPVSEENIAWLIDYSKKCSEKPDGTAHVFLAEWLLNNQRYLNRYMIYVNEKLETGGFFIASFETATKRHEKYYKKGRPRWLSRLLFGIDFFWHRMCPKMKLTKKFYFFVTKNVKRALPRMEVFGRLYYCGFELYKELYIGEHYFIIAKKVKEPSTDEHPSYDPLIKLKRVGKNGKIINVYKWRSMYAYSEYLQKEMFDSNNLDSGGKIYDDFRITEWGKIMRKYWIDEWPMFINVLKGDMCLIGVRPLSLHYYSLYSPELQQLRIKYKPGMLPPFYADNPETLEEIQESEMRYLKAYGKNKFKTKWIYFWKIMKNIFVKHKHSK